jgi:hypothetical protein
MSKVVSFRLDEDTPEEQQALAILEAWQEKGYSTREIMTWALMSLAGMELTEESPQNEGEARETVTELREVLSQAQEFLEALRDMKAIPDEVQVKSQVKPVLSQGFMAAVKKAARPGLSLSDDTLSDTDA